MKLLSLATSLFLFFYSQINGLYGQMNDAPAKAELIADVESIEPGKPFWVGLLIKMEPGWHVYWKNPGATGFAPSIDWELPENFKSSEIHWPIPIKMTKADFVSFGYEGEVLLPIQITPPKDLDPSQPISLKGKAEWLTCKESCIPGNQDLGLTLPIKNSTPEWNSKWHTTFDIAKGNLPQNLSDWKINAYVSKEQYGLLIEPESGDGQLPQSIQFFSYNSDIKTNLPQKLEKTDTGYFLTLPLETTVPEHLEGILINEEGWSADSQNKALSVDIKGYKDEIIEVKTQTVSLTKAMIFAFIGGLILNLMPCVFPILGLKVLSFMKHAGEGVWKARMHGLIFTLGVLASFLALASLLLVLRAGGELIGWGFQLQSPFFITFLCFLLIIIALNFLGVFEIGTSLIALGNGSNHQGYFGTFSSGILATVLATPCSAPFMGTALGFALTQPPYYSLCIFTAVALGMSMPYLILSFSPALIRYLPRPGSWMETFKQAMAFPLIATVLWLLWVFGKQTDHDAVIKLLFGLLLASTAAWIYGRFATFNASTQRRRVAWITSSFFLLTAIALGYSSARVKFLSPVDQMSTLAWEEYSQENFQKLRAEGKAIYIDFTAAWCLTCQANKKNVFSSSQVIETLKNKDVVLLHADWTKNDPIITKALQSYGRSGVPTNVIYPAKTNSSPILLPELLTPNIVLNALKKI